MAWNNSNLVFNQCFLKSTQSKLIGWSCINLVCKEGCAMQKVGHLHMVRGILGNVVRWSGCRCRRHDIAGKYHCYEVVHLVSSLPQALMALGCISICYRCYHYWQLTSLELTCKCFFGPQFELIEVM